MIIIFLSNIIYPISLDRKIGLLNDKKKSETLDMQGCLNMQGCFKLAHRYPGYPRQNSVPCPFNSGFKPVTPQTATVSIVLITAIMRSTSTFFSFFCCCCCCCFVSRLPYLPRRRYLNIFYSDGEKWYKYSDYPLLTSQPAFRFGWHDVRHEWVKRADFQVIGVFVVWECLVLQGLPWAALLSVQKAKNMQGENAEGDVSFSEL